MFTRQDCIKYANDFIKQLLAKGLNLTHAKLFGSYANGTQNENSDIDILLAADEFIGFGYVDISKFAYELTIFDYIHVRTYPTKLFEKGDPFIDEINRTGIELPIN